MQARSMLKSRTKVCARRDAILRRHGHPEVARRAATCWTNRDTHREIWEKLVEYSPSNISYLGSSSLSVSEKSIDQCLVAIVDPAMVELAVCDGVDKHTIKLRSKRIT